VSALKKSKVVLIGLGRMGKNHLRVISQSASFYLLAVLDRDCAEPDPRELGDAHFFHSFEDLANVDFDCAVVATPTSSHFEVAARLIAMGKHVLVEKPLASTFAEGQELLALAREHKVRLAVGHVERFNPAVRKLRETIREGWLGTPTHFAVTRVGGYPETLAEGNNVLLDLAVHDIDVLRSIVGPLKLEGSICRSTVTEGIFDTAEIRFTARCSATVNVHVNWVTPAKNRTIRVTGTHGSCLVDYIHQTCEIEQRRDATARIEFGAKKEEPLKAQLAQFFRFISEGTSDELCLGSDAVGAVLLVERALQLDAARPKMTEHQRAAGNAISASDLWV
jgi:UDP-N-acetylglucosamine 3-dehydrogenase